MKATIKRKVDSKSIFMMIIVLLLLVYSVIVTYLYINKKSVSSSYYDNQAQEIIKKLEKDNLAIQVTNQIDNFVALSEHSLPVGGGGWGVYRKVDGEWQEVFLSQDSTWCELYDQYKLPKGLIGECVNWSDFVEENK